MRSLLHVGYCFFSPFSKGSSTLSATDVPCAVSTSSFIINNGERQALKITNNDPVMIMIITSNSYLLSPVTDPGYPVPELSTMMLTSSGLVIGVGMLAYSNKKKK